MRNVFNPFGKPFDKVSKEDLEILKNVPEGWYIEYKSGNQNAKKIAKSIASFANSHGGIYFLGIGADQSSNCAHKIKGVEDFPDRIRDSVRGNLQPFPHLETFTINITDEEKVLMVVVPEGRNPPFIHADGRIYKRQDSASDPIVPETNRHAVDELYKKALNYEEEIERFRELDLTFSEAEEYIPYLEIYINTSPFREFVIRDFLVEANLNMILQEFSQSITLAENIEGNELNFAIQRPFDTISTYFESVSLRCLKDHHLATNNLTVELDIFGNMKVLLPLILLNIELENIPDELIKVINKSTEGSISSISFIEARPVFGAMMGLIHSYVNYLSGREFNGDLCFKLRLRNCWQRSLFLRSNTYFNYVEKYGLPICMKSKQYFPRKPICLKSGAIQSKPVFSALILFREFANALGVPFAVAFKSIIDEI